MAAGRQGELTDLSGMNALRHIVVTGATGYLGQRFVALALARGLFVTALGRRSPFPDQRRGGRWRSWAFGEAVPADAFDGDAEFPAADALVHIAHRWESPSPEAEDENLLAMDGLLLAARARRIRRVAFCSSVSARQDALNRYGRVKWRCEQRLRAPAEIAARIGLVYGGSEQGQWGALCRLVRATPVLPMVGADRPVQPIHVDDVCEGLLRLAGIPDPSRAVYGLADPVPIPFGRFLGMVARHAFGRRLLVMPLPAALARLLLFLAPERVRERVRGLLGIHVLECRDDLAEIGLTLRKPWTGLAEFAAGRRRLLLVEGRVLLHYLLGQPPSWPSLRAYARGIVRYGDGCPLRLPWIARRCPSLLRLFEPVTTAAADGRPDGLRRRLDLATRLAEALSDGAWRFYDLQGGGRSTALVGLVATLAIEIVLMPLRVILGVRHR